MPPPDDPKSAGRKKRPAKVVHAHDEFELDISVDMNLADLKPAEVLPDLFADLPEGSGEDEEATEILDGLDVTAPEKTRKAARAQAEPLVKTPLKEGVLPIFVPMTGSPPPGQAGGPRSSTPRGKPPRKSTPPPARSTPPPRAAKPDKDIPVPPPPFKATVEDLSSGVFPRPGSGMPLDLALDGLADPKPVLAPGPLPGSEEVSDPALDPLDIKAFEMSTSPPKKKASAGQRTGTTDFRGEPMRAGPAPMAHHQRVVRTLFTFGTREILVLLLLLLIGAGIWVGYMIYQDYSRQLDLDRVEEQRSRMEAAKDSAIDKNKVRPKERDIP